MNRNEDNGDRDAAPLDGLLRRWGAEEAVRRAEGEGEAAPMPEMPPLRPRRSAGTFRRWMPLAAGFVLFACGIGLLVAFATRARAPADGHAVKELRAERDRLRTDLGAARRALADAEGALRDEKRDSAKRLTEQAGESERETSRRLAEQRSEFDAEVAALRRQFEADKAMLAARHAEDRAALGRALADAGKKAAENLAAARREAAAGETALAAAASEARSARDRAERHLAALQSQREALLPVVQGGYLAGAASDAATVRAEREASAEGSLSARQAAAQHYRLLDRCARLRGAVRSDSTRHLLDALEVALTRLAMLDASRRSDAAAFVAMVRKADLADQLAKALPAEGEPPQVGRWLFEVQLVLAGVDHVG